MDEIERPPTLENPFLGIYDARLTFRKIGQGEKVVTIKIRYSKKGRSRKRRLQFPEDINENDLYWTRYRGEQVAVYHRRDTHEYVDMKHSLVHTGLGQKLERLVREAHEKFMKIDTEDMHEND